MTCGCVTATPSYAYIAAYCIAHLPSLPTRVWLPTFLPLAPLSVAGCLCLPSQPSHCRLPRPFPPFPSPCSTERQQGLAAYLLNQVSLMQATAYTLAKVAELSDWKPAREAGSYQLVPFSRCCTVAANLPAGFVQAVGAWGRTLGQQVQAD